MSRRFFLFTIFFSILFVFTFFCALSLLDISWADSKLGIIVTPLKPRIGYKQILVIRNNRIGFGVGGITLNNKYYPEGMMFEIVREETNGNGESYITIDQDGENNIYPRAPFSGSYGSAGYIVEFRWDLANNLPTGLDNEDEYVKKYFHFTLFLLVRYFWLLASVLVLFSAAAFFIFEKKDWKRAKFLTVIFLLFFILGGCQGAEYQNYLDKFTQMSAGQFFRMWSLGRINLSVSGIYTFGNVFFVPLFLLFHAALGYFFCFALPFGYGYLYYLFTPHPAEKYVKAVKAGKMMPDLALLKINDTMYDLEKEGIPTIWQSKAWAKRIEALTERVKAEDKFMQEVINLIKIKSRFS